MTKFEIANQLVDSVLSGRHGPDAVVGLAQAGLEASEAAEGDAAEIAVIEGIELACSRLDLDASRVWRLIVGDGGAH